MTLHTIAPRLAAARDEHEARAQRVQDAQGLIEQALHSGRRRLEVAAADGNLAGIAAIIPPPELPNATVRIRGQAFRLVPVSPTRAVGYGHAYSWTGYADAPADTPIRMGYRWALER